MKKDTAQRTSSFTDRVAAAGLSHLLADYEQSLREAMQHAERHAAQLEVVLEPEHEPALVFVPTPRHTTDE